MELLGVLGVIATIVLGALFPIGLLWLTFRIVGLIGELTD